MNKGIIRSELNVEGSDTAYQVVCVQVEQAGEFLFFAEGFQGL